MCETEAMSRVSGFEEHGCPAHDSGAAVIDAPAALMAWKITVALSTTDEGYAMSDSVAAEMKGVPEASDRVVNGVSSIRGSAWKGYACTLQDDKSPPDRLFRSRACAGSRSRSHVPVRRAPDRLLLAQPVRRKIFWGDRLIWTGTGQIWPSRSQSPPGVNSSASSVQKRWEQ